MLLCHCLLLLLLLVHLLLLTLIRDDYGLRLLTGTELSGPQLLHVKRLTILNQQLALELELQMSTTRTTITAGVTNKNEIQLTLSISRSIIASSSSK